MKGVWCGWGECSEWSPLLGNLDLEAQGKQLPPSRGPSWPAPRAQPRACHLAGTPSLWFPSPGPVSGAQGQAETLACIPASVATQGGFGKTLMGAICWALAGRQASMYLPRPSRSSSWQPTLRIGAQTTAFREALAPPSPPPPPSLSLFSPPAHPEPAAACPACVS